MRPRGQFQSKMSTPNPHPSAPALHPIARFLAIAGALALIAGLLRVNLAPAPLSAPSEAAAGRTFAHEPSPRFVATVQPLGWVLRSLAPEGSVIDVLAPVGAACEGIELTPSHALALSRGNLIVGVGLGLDDALLASGVPSASRRTLTMSEVLSETERAQADRVEVSHGDHTHSIEDPHLWLDPVLMERFVRRVGEAIRASSGPGAALGDLDARIGRAAAMCRAIDEEYRARLAPLQAKAIVTQHPAWGRLARRYGVEVAAVIQPVHGVEPTSESLALAARIVGARQIRAVFTEPQLNPAAAKRVAALSGAAVLTLDPLGDGDWPDLMRRNLDALVRGLERDAAPAPGAP